MSQISKIVVLGGDARQFYLVELLHQLGFPVAVFGLDMKQFRSVIYEAGSMREALSFGNVVIGPTPFSPNGTDIFSKTETTKLAIEELCNHLNSQHTLFGGCISPELKEYCNTHNISHYDFMGIESIAISNSVATAEGAILEAIQRSPIVLHQNRCLILGFGKCAQVLAQKLKGLSAIVSVAARSGTALSLAAAYGYDAIKLSDISKYLCDYPFVFNTIPSLVLDASNLSYVPKDATIIDIASSPGGVNFDYCKQMHLNASLCLSLPGKYAPKTSARILADYLLTMINSSISS